MLQNHMTKIVTNQRKKDFVTLLSNPIENKTVLAVRYWIIRRVND